MQITFRRAPNPTFLRLAKHVSSIGRHLPDSLYVSLAIAAGLLWLALAGF